MSTVYELKKHLHRIIEQAYKDDPKLAAYKDFQLRLRDEEMNSSTGTYDPNDHTIEITNLADGEANNLCTLIHELCHHIETCQRGKTGHQKSFYDIYAKLLYAALDLKRISLHDFQNMEHRNSDYAKVQKILRSYVAKDTAVDAEKTVAVVNAYAIKEELKKYGYHWDDLNRAWTRTLHVREAQAEYDRLISTGVKADTIQMLDANAMRMAKGGHALRVYGAYSIREQLRAWGYHWDKENRCWYKQLSEDSARQEQKKILQLGSFRTEYK